MLSSKFRRVLGRPVGHYGFAVLMAVVTLGCPADDPSETGEGTTGAESSGPGTTTSSGSTSTTTTTASTDESTTDLSTSTTSGSESSGDATSTGGSTTSDGDTGSSSTGICEVGTANCACDEGMCDGALECVRNVCVDPLGCGVNDDAEPNDTEDTAVDLGELACGTAVETSGHVDATDEDWFTYHGVDSGSCDTLTIGIVDSDPTLEVCMFFECDAGVAQATCAAGDNAAASPNGLPGCCGQGDVTFNTTRCNGAVMSDSGNIYLQVRGPDEPACVSYDLAYRFL